MACHELPCQHRKEIQRFNAKRGLDFSCATVNLQGCVIVQRMGFSAGHCQLFSVGFASAAVRWHGMPQHPGQPSHKWLPSMPPCH